MITTKRLLFMILFVVIGNIHPGKGTTEIIFVSGIGVALCAYAYSFFNPYTFRSYKSIIKKQNKLFNKFNALNDIQKAPIREDFNELLKERNKLIDEYKNEKSNLFNIFDFGFYFKYSMYLINDDLKALLPK